MTDISAKEALKQLIDNQSVDILKNGKLCISLLRDMSPSDKEGIENIQLAFDKKLPSLLADANDKSDSERQYALSTMYKKLTDRLNEKTSTEICAIFLYALKWNIALQTIIKSDINQMPSQQSVNVQKVVTYTQPPQQQQYKKNIPSLQTKKNSKRGKILIIAVVCGVIAVIVGGIILHSGKGDNKDNQKNNLSDSNVIDYRQSTSNSTEENNNNGSDYIQTTYSGGESNIENTETNNTAISTLNIEAIPESQTSIEKIEMQKISDKITSEKEKKTYEFTSTEAGRYRFELSDIPNDIYFRMYLYNSDMEQLQYQEYQANGGGLTCDLDANTRYYIVVEQQKNMGSYSLNIGTHKKTVNVSNYTKLNDTIQYTDQRNLYSFKSSEAGKYRFELSDIPNDIYFRMYLYNSDMEQLQYQEYQANGGGLTCDLDENTQYYIVVEQQKNTGSYSLNIGTQKKNVDISGYTKLNDTIQYTDQRNLYNFTPLQTENYKFELSNLPNDTYFKMYLYNSDMEQLNYVEYQGDSGCIIYELNANASYYIVVEQQKNAGNYTMSYGIYKEE